MIGRTNAGLAPLRPKYSIKGWTQTIGLSYSDLSAISEIDMRLLMSKHASVDYFMEWYNADNSMLDMFTQNESAMKWIGQNDYICGKLMYFGQNRDATNEENANIVGFTVPSDFSVQNYVTHGQFIQKSKRVLATSITWTKAAGYDHSFYAPIPELTMNDGNGSQRVYLQGYDYVIANVPNQGDKTIQSYWAYWSAMPRVFIKDNSITTVEQLTSALSGKYIYYELSTPIIHNFGHSEAGDKLLASKYWPYILKDKVPIMTANDAPYGEASASSVFNSYLPYIAFDGTTNSWLSTYRSTSLSTPIWIKYKFTNPICIKKSRYKLNTNVNTTSVSILFEVSNDDVNWTPLGTSTDFNSADFSNDSYFLYIRTTIQSGTSAVNAYWGFESLQFYGRSLNISESSAPTDGRPYKLIGSVYYTVDYSDRTERTYLYDHGVEVVPMQTYSNGNNASVTKEADCLHLVDNNGSAFCLASNESLIDVTPYKLVRCVIGDVFKISLDYKIAMSITRNDISSWSSFASKDIGTNIPYNEFLDISSINESVRIGFLSSSYNNGVEAKLTELWLE